MLTVNNVTIDGNNRYGGPPTFGVKVVFQVGGKSYSTAELTLVPEDAREVVELAVAKATAMLRVAPSDLRIEGEPIPVISAEDAPNAPEFAEVDEVPPPVPAVAPSAIADAEIEEAPESFATPAPQPEEAF